MALLLSNLATAGVQRRTASTVTITACEASQTPQPSPVPPLESSGESAPVPVVVLTTITLLPEPTNTASEDPFPHFPFPTGKGIPSGILYPGFGTGTRCSRPTGHPRFRNHTHHTHHHHHPTGYSNTDSIPFFTLTYTGTIPLPTPILTVAPVITITNTGPLILPSSISTDCPDMSSTAQISSNTTSVVPELESYSAASPSTALATYPSYRRRRAARAGGLRNGS